MPYKIDKGVTVPAARAKYPFCQMEPGDSFFVPAGNVNSLRVLCSRHSQGDKVFISRTVDGGVRIWRVNPKAGADKSFPRGDDSQSRRRGRGSART